MQWFPATAEMTPDDFKHSLTVAADAALAYGVESILVDVRDFHPSAACMELNAWRVQNIIPKYNQVLKRFAWLGGAELAQTPGSGNTYQGAGESYQSRWFQDEIAAISWATTHA